MKDDMKNSRFEMTSTENGIDATFSDGSSRGSDTVAVESVKMENGYEKPVQMEEEMETTSVENLASAMETHPVYKTNLASSGKFTCIGKVQLINKSLLGNAKPAEKKKKKSVNSLTQMIVIRNVMSKEKKPPLYNFKIRPVHKGILSWKQTPVVYVGAPLLNQDNIENEEYAKNVLESLQLSTTGTSSGMIRSSEDEFSMHQLGDVFDASAVKVETHQAKIKDSIMTYERNFKDEIFSNSIGSRSSAKFPGFDIANKTPNTVTVNSLPGTHSVNTTPETALSNIVQIIARTVPSAVSATSIPTTVTLTQITKGDIKMAKSIKIAPKKIIKKLPGKPVSTFTFPHSIPVTASTILSAAKTNRVVQSIASNTVLTDSTKLVMSAKQVVTVSSSHKPTSVSNPFMTISVLPQPAGSKVPCLPLRNIVVKTSLADGKSSQPVKALFIPCSIKTSDISVKKVSQPNSKETKQNKTIALKASSTLAKIVQAHKSDRTATTKVLKTISTTVVKNLLSASSDCKAPKRKREDDSGALEYNKPTKRLRTGVEIAFVDGVRHFITSLKQMTYLDDEPIKSWSHLKKGTKVAALWKDGLFYDATVVACYFPNDKYTGVVEVITALENEGDETPAESSPTNVSKKAVKIMCSKCRTVFLKISEFRKHQKSSCKSYGINIMSENNDKNIDTSESKPSENSTCSAAVENRKKEANNNISVRPQDPLPVPTLDTGEKSPCRDKNQNSLTQFPTPLVNGTKPSAPISPGGHYLFSVGTRFLHRWQLDDGSSKWYQGEVKKILSPKSDPECEFEVLYKEEEDQGPYVVKLYEDYPFDIRIMGQS